MSRIVVLILTTVVTLSVVACGGGYPSNRMSTPQSSGTIPVMTTGVITGFGSIFVGGVHFQTTAATIRKNGLPVTQSELSVGEIARVKGDQDASGANGVAESVDVDENVVGPIASIDTTNSVITVLGQTVKINTGTSFTGDVQPPGIAGLAVGQVVRVSGLVDSSGNIAATRIERTPSSTLMQVVGTVASLDSSTQTFKISGLTVSFARASLEGFAVGQPVNGDLVEVQGTTFDATTVTLTATQVARQESDQEQAGDARQLEREGLITRFASATDFDVAGQPVTTTATTVFRNGSAMDLALNVKVEVSGMVNSANVLVAQVLEFHHNGGLELQAQANAVNAAAGTLTLLGVQVTVTADTRFEDHSPAQLEMFSLADVNNGDTIDVVGFEDPSGSGKITATRLEREPASATVLVRGPSIAATAPDLMVLGISVDASGATLLGLNGSALTLADFLSQAAGHSVEVSGTLVGNVIAATEIRLLPDEDGSDD